MPNTVQTAYAEQVAAGHLNDDPVQRTIATKLSQLQHDLEFVRGKSILSRLWQTRHSGSAHAGQSRIRPGLQRRRAPNGSVRGLYIHGGVGRGKTLLMDMFFAKVAMRSKQRWHFHAFMHDVHARIAEKRKSVPGDPIAPVAKDILRHGELICFDEFHITDIADAMILGRLFNALFDGGAIVVATSNVAPRDLYRDGLNRDLFLPFIDILEAQMEVMSVAGEVDHRLRALDGRRTYFSPLGPEATAQLRGVWQDLTGVSRGRHAALTIAGRDVEIPEQHGCAALGSFKSWFDFDGWSDKALGPGDYLAMAEAYDWIFVTDVPQLTASQQNAARRFITFVDAIYDAGGQLVVTAAVPPNALYPEGVGADLFERTASRLTELSVAQVIADGAPATERTGALTRTAA